MKNEEQSDEWSESSEEAMIRIDTTPRSTSISKKLKWDQTPLGIVKSFGVYEHSRENRWDLAPSKKVQRTPVYTLKDLDKILPAGYEIYTPSTKYERCYNQQCFLFLEKHSSSDAAIIEHLLAISDGIDHVLNIEKVINKKYIDKLLKRSEDRINKDPKQVTNNHISRISHSDLKSYLKNGDLRNQVSIKNIYDDNRIQIVLGTKKFIMTVKILNTISLEPQKQILLLKNLSVIVNAKLYRLHKVIIMLCMDFLDSNVEQKTNEIITSIFQQHTLESLLSLCKDNIKNPDIQNQLSYYIAKLATYFGINKLDSFLKAMAFSQYITVNILYLNIVRRMHLLGISIEIYNLRYLLRYEETLKVLSFCSTPAKDMSEYIKHISVGLKSRKPIRTSYNIQAVQTISVLLQSEVKRLKSLNLSIHQLLNYAPLLQKYLHIMRGRGLIKVFSRIYSLLESKESEEILLNIIENEANRGDYYLRELFSMINFRKACTDLMRDNSLSYHLFEYMQHDEVISLFIDLRSVKFSENQSIIYFENLKKYIRMSIEFINKEDRKVIKANDFKEKFIKNRHSKPLEIKERHKNIQYNEKGKRKCLFNDKFSILKNIPKLLSIISIKRENLEEIITITLEGLSNHNQRIGALLVIESIVPILEKRDIEQYLILMFDSVQQNQREILPEVLSCIYRIIKQGVSLSESHILDLSALLKLRISRISYKIFKIFTQILNFTQMDKYDSEDPESKINPFPLIKKREWLRIIHDCVDNFESHRKIRSLSIQCIKQVSNIIGPFEILYILIEILRGNHKNIAAKAISEVSRATGLHSIIPILLIEYSNPEYQLKTGILKTLMFIFEYPNEINNLDARESLSKMKKCINIGIPPRIRNFMAKENENKPFTDEKSIANAQKFIPAIVGILTDALTQKDIEFRKLGMKILGNILYWHENTEFAIHFFNIVFPNIFEEKVKEEFDELIPIFAIRIRNDIFKYLSQGMWSGSRKIRERYWEIYWIISKNQDILPIKHKYMNFNLKSIINDVCQE